MRSYYRKYLVLAIIGAVIIGLAFYLLLNSYLDKKEIIVASRKIQAGEKLKEEDLGVVEYYKNSLPESYITNKEDVIGKIINIDRRKDDYIAGDMFNEKIQGSIFDDLAGGDVVIAVNVEYTEPLLKEINTGNCISIISTVYDKEYLDYLKLFETGDSKHLNQTEYNSYINEMKSKNYSLKNDYIDNATFNLSENIISINGQIVIRNLEVLSIEKNISGNRNILLNNSENTTSVYLKCNIKEAPIVARLIKNDDYKIIVEEI